VVISVCNAFWPGWTRLVVVVAAAALLGAAAARAGGGGQYHSDDSPKATDERNRDDDDDDDVDGDVGTKALFAGNKSSTVKATQNILPRILVRWLLLLLLMCEVILAQG